MMLLKKPSMMRRSKMTPWSLAGLAWAVVLVADAKVIEDQDVTDVDDAKGPEASENRSRLRSPSRRLCPARLRSPSQRHCSQG